MQQKPLSRIFYGSAIEILLAPFSFVKDYLLFVMTSNWKIRVSKEPILEPAFFIVKKKKKILPSLISLHQVHGMQRRKLGKYIRKVRSKCFSYAFLRTVGKKKNQ